VRGAGAKAASIGGAGWGRAGFSDTRSTGRSGGVTGALPGRVARSSGAGLGPPMAWRGGSFHESMVRKEAGVAAGRKSGGVGASRAVGLVPAAGAMSWK
jgi:hypothetical protein